MSGKLLSESQCQARIASIELPAWFALEVLGQSGTARQQHAQRGNKHPEEMLFANEWFHPTLPLPLSTRKLIRRWRRVTNQGMLFAILLNVGPRQLLLLNVAMAAEETDVLPAGLGVFIQQP